jgi:hypothetical protein
VTCTIKLKRKWKTLDKTTTTTTIIMKTIATIKRIENVEIDERRKKNAYKLSSVSQFRLTAYI